MPAVEPAPATAPSTLIVDASDFVDASMPLTSQFWRFMISTNRSGPFLLAFMLLTGGSLIVWMIFHAVWGSSDGKEPVSWWLVVPSLILGICAPISLFGGYVYAGHFRRPAVMLAPRFWRPVYAAAGPDYSVTIREFWGQLDRYRGGVVVRADVLHLLMRCAQVACAIALATFAFTFLAGFEKEKYHFWRCQACLERNVQFGFFAIGFAFYVFARYLRRPRTRVPRVVAKAWLLRLYGLLPMTALVTVTYFGMPLMRAVILALMNIYHALCNAVFGAGISLDRPTFWNIPIAIVMLYAAWRYFLLFLILFGWSLPKFERAARLLQRSPQEYRQWDRRRPVLLLRSFADDPVKIQARAAEGGEDTGSDVRMEETLRNPASHYGPFVAIGEPGTLPQLDGAIVAFVGDEEWKAKVLAEMAEAALVIFIASDTPGLRWEIETAIERGHLGKCVVALPHPDLGMPSKAQRWTAVCACFEGTPWHAPMAALDIGAIRAVHFRSARELVAIATRTAFARDYEVAMHVAVYGMFCR